ncbi:MAG: hypothetical protein R3F43_27930 [bacterium]
MRSLSPGAGGGCLYREIPGLFHVDALDPAPGCAGAVIPQVTFSYLDEVAQACGDSLGFNALVTRPGSGQAPAPDADCLAGLGVTVGGEVPGIATVEEVGACSPVEMMPGVNVRLRRLPLEKIDGYHYLDVFLIDLCRPVCRGGSSGRAPRRGSQRPPDRRSHAMTTSLVRLAQAALAFTLLGFASQARAASEMGRGWCYDTAHSRVLLDNADAILAWQADGNLVIYNRMLCANPAAGSASAAAVWATGTGGIGRNLCFQGDGNLVVYGANGPVWASGTEGAVFKTTSGNYLQ